MSKDDGLSVDDDKWVEFLLSEHSYFASSFWHSEEVGEKRISFFTSLVSAFLAALIGLATIIGVNIAFYLSGMAALGFLLLLGIAVLLRLLHRNEKTDEWKARLDLVRQQFLDKTTSRKDYKPFNEEKIADLIARYPKRRLRGGGLVTSAIMINS